MSNEKVEISNEKSTVIPEVIGDKNNIINNYLEDNQETNYTDYESEAMKKGWKPKDQYKGEDWRPAKEFLDRGELIDKIQSQSKKLKNLEKTMQNVEELMKRREEFARQQERKALEHTRMEAIQSGDVEAVNKLDEDLYRVRRDEEHAKNQQTEIPEEAKDWVNRHKETWFNKNSLENIEMVEEAEKLGRRIHDIYPDKSASEQLAMIEDQIKKKYPHRFKNINRERPMDVESSNEPSPKSKSSYDKSKITEGLRKIAQDMVNHGVVKTKEDYYNLYFGVK